MPRSSVIILSLLFFMTMFILPGCRDDIELSADASLLFSADTVRFDTVFSGIRSSTMTLMVRNPNKGRIRLQHIYLDKGEHSEFRFNIDGISGEGNSVTDVEIEGKDSVYVLIDVKNPENGSNQPLFVHDVLHFVVNGSVRDVVLESYGQDVIIFRDKVIHNDSILASDKPYLVYGYLSVDEGRKLTLPPGTKIYFHDAAPLIIYGSLHAQGTLESPILLRGDRLDNLFEKVPYSMVSGQWDGVYLLGGEVVHELNYVEIKSCQNGIYASSKDRNTIQSINIHNCRIHNNAGTGLTAINSNLNVVNTEISNCASYCVYLAGGKHDFIHCTIANFYGNTNVNIQRVHRESLPAVCINDIPKTAQMSTSFTNCIVTGTQRNELSLLSYFDEQYPMTLKNCYLRTDSIEDNRYQDIRYWHWDDKVFVNDYYRLGEYVDYDFHLSESSPARGIGLVQATASYPIDRDGNNRLVGETPSDVGCYQFLETEE